MHSIADGPGASKARDNGSRKPPLGVDLQNLAHSHGSARFAAWTPPHCRSMTRGCFKNDRADASWTIPFQDLARFTKIVPAVIHQAAKHSTTFAAATHSRFRFLLAAPCPQRCPLRLTTCVRSDCCLAPRTAAYIQRSLISTFIYCSDEVVAFCHKKLVTHDCHELCEDSRCCIEIAHLLRICTFILSCILLYRPPHLK